MSVQTTAQLQYSDTGELRHLLTTEGLSRQSYQRIFELADSLTETQGVRKLPVLRGKTIVLLFFEPSTRTRTTFEIAANRLSADVTVVSVASSATSKGESLFDTVETLQAMQADMFVVRHAQSGAAHLIAEHVAPNVSVVNAGDGCHAHPTQALLDMYTIRQKKGDVEGLRVAIVGDLLHSRVARSQIHALRALGAAQINLIGPQSLVPDRFAALGCTIHRDLRAGLAGVDVVMGLRMQRERMEGGLLPSNREYFHHYGLTRKRLDWAAENAIVMHPGPVNRGVEIDSDLMDDERSVILDQVTNGIAVRMAAMSLVLGRAWTVNG
ncbi:MAG TPA: aspartate carbamoyltransferase catalytic subunit [Gammaproteobacteria bacterium]|nr:aspartate carbamoyltransferase catalytic subunit [Gammaproteobacteria bacterium]